MHRLALALHRPVGELLDTIDSRELTEWQAFDSVDPFGDWRMDYLFGMLASLHVNMNRKKNTKPVSPQEFMVFMPEDPDEKAANQQEQLLAFAQAWNAQLKAKEGNQPPKQ